MTNQIVENIVKITSEMVSTGVVSIQSQVPVEKMFNVLEGSRRETAENLVNRRNTSFDSGTSGLVDSLDLPTIMTKGSDRADVGEYVTVEPMHANQKRIFQYERIYPAIIKEWLSKEGEKVNRIRSRTDISIKEFLELLKQHRVEELIVEQFRYALSRHIWRRTFFDSQLEKLVERIKFRAEDLARVHSSLWIHRMSLLLGLRRFTIAGVVQLIEQEESGSIDFDKAIDVDEKSRPLREQCWEQILSSGRLKEIAMALDVIPGIKREKVPGLIAEAVVDAARQEPWILAGETGLPVLGIIRIDVDDLEEDAAMVLAALCSWMNVPFWLGKFQDKEFLEDMELTNSVRNAVKDKLFFPFRTELTDCGVWNSMLSGNYETLRDCKFVRECIPSAAFDQIQERFAGLLDTIEEEAQYTYRTYWPLHRTTELAVKQKEEWKQIDQHLKNYLKGKNFRSC